MTEYFEKTAGNRSHVILASRILIVELLQIKENEEQKRRRLYTFQKSLKVLPLAFQKRKACCAGISV